MGFNICKLQLLDRNRKGWFLLLVILFQFLGRVNSQRVIASLGSKLKRLGLGQSSKRRSDNDYIVQGEGNEIIIKGSFLHARGDDSSKFVSMVVLFLTTVFLLSYRERWTNQQKEEDDIVVEDDHLGALGGLSSVELAFSDIRMELKVKDRNSGSGTRVLLDGSIEGCARPGRMLAIMGPSGAGKSTLLHALAGTIKENSKVYLEGNRYINKNPIAGDSRVPSAFVQQEVSFFPHMTVRETLFFRVELKLGSRISKSSREDLVDSLISQLGLEKAADTTVGDAKVRGISGGERRRLAIACELISSPSIIFLDEPTSGLDSTAAAALVETLRNLANSGKTVIAVIHQPSQHVFAAFDDLLLVSEGKQMYFGEVAKVRQYMDNHVSKAPAEMGTAEHILDCISGTPMLGETKLDAERRINMLADVAKVRGDTFVQRGGSPEQYNNKSGVGPKASILIQFKLLLRRAVRENFRGKVKLILQTVQQVSLGLIYGGIYSLGNNQASIQDRFGILSLIVIGSANMAMASTIRSFPKEKLIVSSELSAKLYGTLPYFISKAISEIPQTAFFNSLFGILVSVCTGLNNSTRKLQRFLGLNSLHGITAQSAGLLIGAVSPNSDVALAIFPALLILNLVFDGRNISEENTPRLLRWVPKVGLIRWGFEGLCLNEFEGLQFEVKGQRRGPAARNGEEALARFGLAGKNLGNVVQAQLVITATCWFLSYLGLSLTKQRFQIMAEPKAKLD